MEDGGYVYEPRMQTRSTQRTVPELSTALVQMGRPEESFQRLRQALLSGVAGLLSDATGTGLSSGVASFAGVGAVPSHAILPLQGRAVEPLALDPGVA
jgi:hypothetical protein